jgi:signal transduction histidine kinase
LWGFVHNLQQKLEKFLRIDRLERTSDILRARAVYVISFTFLLSQIANFALLNYTYVTWTSDHWVGVVVSVCVAISIIALRYTKKFVVFTGFYSLLFFSGITMSAITDYTGINTALLSFLTLGAVINGFISGWRMVLIYGVAAIILVWYLYGISASAPTGALFDPTLFYTRILQRAIQVTIALVLIVSITAFASYSMHSAFYMLEDKITQTQKAEQEKAEFLANMSHELRTPLNGIMGFVGLVRKTNLQPKQAKFIDIIANSSSTLLAIVNDSLDISKIDSGKLKLRSAPFDLGKTIQSVVHLHQPLALTKGVKLKFIYPEQLETYYIGDENRTRQILDNLASNAIKFTDEGSVTLSVKGIETAPEEMRLIISVSDTGVGIAKNDQKKIFHRFSQLDNKLSRNHEGTGLGLSLCRDISHLMNGHIELISEPGQGSTFTLDVTLPVCDQEQKEALQSTSDHKQSLSDEDLELVLMYDDEIRDSDDPSGRLIA